MITDDRPFRFGVNLVSVRSRDDVVTAARRAEDLGYDVVSVADHLGLPAPIPSLVLMAEATERITLGTSVLNTAFYTPHLLVRDIGAVDGYCGGRLEIGLGAGYVREEFDAAGLPFPPARDRVAHLERTVEAFRAEPDRSGSRLARLPGPAFTRPDGPRLLVAGRGDRVLRLAAERADVVAFTGTTKVPDGDVLRLADDVELAERTGFVRDLLGDRVGEVELNLTIQRVLRRGGTVDADPWGNELDPARLDRIPTVLVGSPAECADRLRHRRERLGLTYFSVNDPQMESFAEVIAHLR